MKFYRLAGLAYSDGLVQPIQKITIFETVLIFLLTVSISCNGLLILNHFSSISALVMGSFLALLILYGFKVRPSWKQEGTFSGMFSMLVIFSALCFRGEPYLMLLGGRDDGTYVAVSQLYENQGKNPSVDFVRERFAEAGLTEYYDQYNSEEIDPIAYPLWPNGRNHLGRSFIINQNQSTFQPMFFPLNSLWMSIFGKLFGPENCVYSLVFLGIISIFSMAYLGRELMGGGMTPAYVIALLLIVSPIHSYFSKFPVAEMSTFTFLVSSLYFFAKYFRLRTASNPLGSDAAPSLNVNTSDGVKNGVLQGAPALFYLSMSCLMLSAYFTSRVSTFILVPEIILLLAVALSCSTEKLGRIRSELILFSLGALAVFLVCYAVNVRLNYWYTTGIYKQVLQGVFGKEKGVWIGKIVVSAGILALLIFSLTPLKTSKLTLYLRSKIYFLATCLLGVAVLLGFYRAYTFAYLTQTPDYSEWAKGGVGWVALWRTSLFVLTENLGYLGMILCLFGVFHFMKAKRIQITALICVLAPLLVYLLVFNWESAYQYYYSRYSFSEVYPLCILLVGCYLADIFEPKRAKRNWVVGVFAVLLAINFWMTSYQFQGREASKLLETFRQLARYVGPNDLILMDRDSFEPFERVKTPLYFFYNMNVSTQRDGMENFDEDVVRLKKLKYDHIFLFAGPSVPSYPYLDRVAQLRFYFNRFEFSPHFPQKMVDETWSDLSLYQINFEKFEKRPPTPILSVRVSKPKKNKKKVL